MSRAARAALLALSVSLLPACRGCRDDDKASPRDATSGAREVSIEIPAANRFAAPEWRDDPSPRGVGFPTGCTLELPLKKAPLADGARFFADGDVLGSLAFGVASGNRVESRALVDLQSRKTRDLPWGHFDAPPLIARADSGWVAAITESAEGTLARALLWREGRSALELARGDQLELGDLACDGDRCALLTTLASETIGPGATLAIGEVTRPETWKRIDILPDAAEPWRPLAIVRFDAGGAEVALGNTKRVALWRARDPNPEKLGEVATRFGAWDVVTTPSPLVIGAGADVDAGCALDPFPLRLAPLTGAGRDVAVTVPPDGVIARPLSKGAFVAWVAPVSCQIDDRVLVHALRVDEKGAATSAPMGVADATGFALATEGDRVSLWLRTREGITWVRGRCP